MRKQAPRAYWISLGLFAVAIILFVWAAIAGATSFTAELEKAKEADKASEVVAPAKDTDVPTKPAAIPETGSTNYDPANPDPAVVEKLQQEAAPQQMERIPFTNKEVTPGDPQSYDGTYGQCPFYENAMGGKGCQVPPGLTCNADWSYCEPTTTNTNQEDAQNGTIESLRAAEPSPAPEANQGIQGL
jgi:hypothetical protein